MIQQDRPAFRYAADPVCWSAVLLYAANRWWLKPWGVGGEFTRDYLNDLLCLPVFLPMILYAQRRLRLRRSDAFPRTWEILQHWVVFSVVFEAVVPALPRWFRSTADPLDAVAYLAGGVAAMLVWSRRGRGRVVSGGRRFYDSVGRRMNGVVSPAAAGPSSFCR